MDTIILVKANVLQLSNDFDFSSFLREIKMLMYRPLGHLWIVYKIIESDFWINPIIMEYKCMVIYQSVDICPHIQSPVKQ